jgi:hypothetical protein
VWPHLAPCETRSAPARLALVLSWLVLVLFLAACGFLMWLSRRIEPHWVSKDGQRFTCRVADLSPEHGEVGPWAEARVASNGDALTVAVKPKVFRSPKSRRPVVVVRVLGRAESDRAGLLIYMLGGQPPMALRVPKSSRAVKTLDQLAALNNS